jgi:hypothetical protein
MKPIEILFDRLLHTDSGQAVVSIILGFGLAALFQRVCKGSSCIIIQAPPMDDVIKNTYTIDGDCFRYTPVPTECVKTKH